LEDSVNTAIASSVVALLVCSPAFSAQPPADEHAGHHPDAATAPTAPPTPAPAAGKSTPSMQGMQGMQDNMKRMQDLMAKISASKNPEERQQLLKEHSKAMRDQMDMMRKMGAGRSGMMGSDMMKNHQTMMDRVDMMEMTMGQMMQHMDAMQDSKP
jgi:hypothetical protein